MWLDRTPTIDISRLGWSDRIHLAQNRRCVSRSRQHVSTRTREKVNGYGTEIVADTPVAPVNILLHSLFSQVDVYLNDTLVTPSSNTYPFRSYVETLLSHRAEAKKTQFTSQLWYKDTAGHMEGTTVKGGNRGLVERGRHLPESRVVDMMGRLHVDIFLQDIFLLNGVDVKIRLVRSKDAFSLMADGQNLDYKVWIVEAILFERCLFKSIYTHTCTVLGHKTKLIATCS